MKLSPDASRKATILAWNPANLDDQSQARLRYQPQTGRTGGNGHLAESLFAPALSDDFTGYEQGSGLPEPHLEDNPAMTSGRNGQPWLQNEFGQERPMEDSCKTWIPGEIMVEPVGALRESAGLSVEGIRQAALAVAREAVLETMRQEAEQIASLARSEAAEIIAQARRDAEEELRRARQEGLVEARAQAESLLEMMATTVSEAQSWQANLMRRSERIILGLVQDIALKLFGEGFTLDAPTLGLTFERSLAEAKSLGDLRMRVHPGDLAMLGELWPTHQTALRGQRIEMIPDLDIQRGGCFIEGQFGSVDGRLESQLRVLSERLEQELADSERPDQAFVPFTPGNLPE